MCLAVKYHAYTFKKLKHCIKQTDKAGVLNGFFSNKVNFSKRTKTVGTVSILMKHIWISDSLINAQVVHPASLYYYLKLSLLKNGRNWLASALHFKRFSHSVRLLKPLLL